MRTNQKNYTRPTVFKYGYLIIVLLFLLVFNQIIMDSFGFFIEWLSSIAQTNVKYESAFDPF